MQGSSSERRVRVMFENHPPQDYRADAAAAEEFAISALLNGAVVIIDNNATPAMPPLPATKWPATA